MADTSAETNARFVPQDNLEWLRECEQESPDLDDIEHFKSAADELEALRKLAHDLLLQSYHLPDGERLSIHSQETLIARARELRK